MIKDEAVGVKMEEMTAAAADGGGGNGTGGGVGGFDPMEEDPHIWLDREQENLLDVTDASIFYNDFPPLPDFPCMSSSSSSSSTPAVSRPGAVTSSSSSAVSSSPPDSWASLMKSDGEEMNFQHGEDREVVKLEPATLSSTASMEIPPPPSDLDGGLGDVDCLNVMETFGYMDLIDSNEIWDPSSVFQTENLNPQEFFEDPAAAAAAAPPPEESHSFSSFLQENSELAMIFLEWLKQNKDYISAEDMRSIKLKRATIESASKRLGSDKEGKKQLLKLILEWVEQHQLQKKKTTADPNPNPSPNPNFSYTTPLPPDPNACFWAPPPPEVTPMMAAAPPPPPFPGYGCDPYSNQIPMVPMNHHHHVMPYQAVMDHNTPPQTWPVSSPYPMPQPQYMSPYPDNNGGMMTHQQAFYGNNSYSVFDPNGERLMRLGSSATKEARKKRMARQRRMYSHHHRHSSNSSQHQNQSNEDCNVGADGGEVDGDQAGSPGSWVYWSGGGGASSPTNGNAPPADVSQPHSGDRPPAQTHQRQASSDRRPQVWFPFLVYDVRHFL